MRKATIADFVLVEQISSSPWGEVWRAQRKGDRRAVVVKLVDARAREDVVARFHREAQIVSKLAGCAVAAPVARGTEGRWHFLALDQIEGTVLRHALEAEGALAPARAAWILAGLLEALAGVHACGVVHRDVKPDNVIVAPRGGVCLVDFGLATYAGDRVEDDESTELLTTDDTLLGSLAYMAPEQIDGGFATPAGDIYAAGVVAFEMLSGRLPFDAPTGAAQISLKRLRDAPRLRELGVRVSTGLDGLVASMIARSPSRRPASAQAALAILADGAR